MMKIVNRTGLPELIFKWLQQDNYDYISDPKTISTTTLLKPIQEILLTRKYHDKIEVDATDRIWSLFGSAVHKTLEGLEEDGIKQEQRLFAEIDGYKVSGKFDVIYGNTLHDYKVTKAYTVVYKSRYGEWSKQMSIYRWLRYKQPDGIILNDTAKIIAILRDWDEKAVGRLNYPTAPIIEIVLPLLSLENTEKLIKERIELLKGGFAGNIPPCTDDERWYNSKKDEYMKCSRYCVCSGFCEQHLHTKKENKQ